MRLPSGATPAPWFTSMPSITPTTLLVAGSMMWTLSPALLVWMIRTLLPAADAGSVNNAAAAAAATAVPARDRQDTSALIIINSSTASVRFVRLLAAEHEGLQRLPLGIVLRGEVFAA